MQVFVEFMTAAAIWVAATVLSQFGVEVDLRDHAPRQERVIERVRSDEGLPVATVCPDEVRARKAPAARTAAA
jgi:hypothetical protein